MEPLLRIEPCDRAAAGADFNDVDDRRFDGKAAHVTAGVVDRVHREAAIFNQCAFGRGAAHVESDDVFET